MSHKSSGFTRQGEKKPRILSVWIPNWPIQRLVVAQPRLRWQPVVLHATLPGRDVGFRVAACSPAAQRQGVSLGMPLGEATAVLRKAGVGSARANTTRANTAGKNTAEENTARAGKGRAQSAGKGLGLCIQAHDPAADEAALGKLADDCERFSPLVGWRTTAGVALQVVPADFLLLEVSGLGPLFGGETRLLEEVRQAFHQQGYQVQLAIADTVAIAWSVARWMAAPEQPQCVTSSQTPAVLDALPVEALRLPAATLLVLEQLGIERIGQLLQLPREGLARRLGEELLVRLDQALGARPEHILGHRPLPQYVASRCLEHPLTSRSAVRQLLSHLLEQVVKQLAGRDCGALQVNCRLDCEGGPVRVVVHTFRPLAEVRHLEELVHLHLEQLELPGDVGRAEVSVPLTAPRQHRQGSLFEEGLSDRQLGPFLNRLSSRLGRENVVRPYLRAGAQPERAFGKRPLTGRRTASRRRQVSPPPAGQRPLRLLRSPARIQVQVLAPQGTPVRFQWQQQTWDIARHWGPERIETGWWRGPSVQRDYYRVETRDGSCFWIFRQLRESRWFLHGEFW